MDSYRRVRLQTCQVVLLILLNHNNFYQQMQNFGNCLSSFMPVNTPQYFFVLPNCFNPSFSYYPFTGSFQIDSQNQVLASPPLDMNLDTNQHSTEPKEDRKDFDKPKKSLKCAKSRKSQSQKEEEQQSFSVKITKNEPCVTYKKKNTESNIVNQTFSFLNSDRCRKLVTRILNNNQKIEEYYRIMTKVKQLNKKYINRNYLKKLLAFDSSPEFEKAFLKAKATSLNIQEVSTILRKLIFNFLKEQVNMTLMTSGKIYKETLPEHFWRKREIITFLFGESKM